jgi:thiamine transport system substrate-binding protein
MIRARTVAALVAVALVLAACDDDGSGIATTTTPSRETTNAAGPTASPAPAGSTITLVTYDSWADDLDQVLADFTASTGAKVEVLKAGDTGTMVSKAVLTAGNPEGDVMFGVDNTFLSKAVDAKVFEPYSAQGLGDVPAALTGLVPGGEATPIDYGDVCINVDMKWFAAHELQPPADLDALADPAYKGLLVVENPASSSPGLAFMLATIVKYGEDGWVDYWKRLRDNGVDVVDTWDDAYYGTFTGGGKGDKPIVVSYASSPPAEVVFADPPIDEATTASVEGTCFRQVEFAGVLRGTEHPEAARQLVDFLLSARFQQELPLHLFVYPANDTVSLPKVFTDNATVPAHPATMDPTTIAANREAWLETWTDNVLR